jgi:hypothetical protein
MIMYDPPRVQRTARNFQWPIFQQQGHAVLQDGNFSTRYYQWARPLQQSSSKAAPDRKNSGMSVAGSCIPFLMSEIEDNQRLNMLHTELVHELHAADKKEAIKPNACIYALLHSQQYFWEYPTFRAFCLTIRNNVAFLSDVTLASCF